MSNILQFKTIKLGPNLSFSRSHVQLLFWSWNSFSNGCLRNFKAISCFLLQHFQLPIFWILWKYFDYQFRSGQTLVRFPNPHYGLSIQLENLTRQTITELENIVNIPFIQQHSQQDQIYIYHNDRGEGVGDVHRYMHRLHDMYLAILSNIDKNCIVK